MSRATREVDRRIDRLTAGFERELRSILFSAAQRAAGRLRDAVGGDHRRALVPRSERFWRGVSATIRESIRDAGYPGLIEAFVASWDGHMASFDAVIEEISASLKTPLKARLAVDDINALAAQQRGAAGAFDAVVDGVVAGFEKRALYQVGALTFGDLVEHVSEAFGRTATEAQTLASTAQVVFYRNIADRGFRGIEKEYALRYGFEGPVDKLTRPFCKMVVKRSRKTPMTRAEIDRLDNEQLPNVFLTGGGFNCRHQWMVVEAEKKR